MKQWTLLSLLEIFMEKHSHKKQTFDLINSTPIQGWKKETLSAFYIESLIEKLPAASPNCKFVISKVEDRKASGYFIAGIMIEGLKPITKSDAMKQTFTGGFSTELKFTFSNVRFTK